MVASKLNIIIPKYQCLLSQEEKKDGNKCEILEIVITSDHEEETTSVGQNDAD